MHKKLFNVSIIAVFLISIMLVAAIACNHSGGTTVTPTKAPEATKAPEPTKPKANIFHGTFDTSDRINANIKSGVTEFATDQQQYLQGYGAIQALALKVRKNAEPVNEIFLTGPKLVTASDFDFKDVAQTEEIDIIVVQHARKDWDSWWAGMEVAMTDAAKDYNVNLQISAPDSFDLSAVNDLIAQAIASRPDAIAVTVTDPTLFKANIERAVNAGIPVIGFNAGNGPKADDIPYIAYYGQDEYTGGKVAGEELVKAAGSGSHEGVCVNHQVGSTALTNRCKGFEDALKAAGINARVLETTDDPVASQSTIADFFAANSGVDIVLTLGPNSANPFYGYIEGRSGGTKLYHGTFDTSDRINENIRNGVTEFATDQQQYLQGYGAIQALALKVRKNVEPVNDLVLTGPKVVRAADLDFKEVSREEEIDIIVVQHARKDWDSWWAGMEVAMTDAAKVYNANVQISAPDSYDLSAVNDLIAQAIASRPDAIAVTVTDPTLFKANIERAVNAGIPVIGFNAGNGPKADGIPYISYYGQDEYTGGRVAGEELVKAAGSGSHKGVCVNHQVGSTALTNRCKGFEDALKAAGFSSTVLETTDDPVASQATIADFFAANSDIDIVLTLGPNSANPFFSYLESR